MKPILYAEDEPADVFFLELAFQKAGIPHPLATVADGAQAIQYLSGAGPFANRKLHPLPCLVLLDIHMPKRTGFEVLEWIRGQPRLKSLPVLVFTSSSNPADMERARQLAANDYLVKPSHPAKLFELAQELARRWLTPPAGVVRARVAREVPEPGHLSTERIEPSGLRAL